MNGLNNLKRNNMNIKATFIGTDSLGYVNNQEYTLKLNLRPYGKMVINKNTSRACVYNSVISFF
jgi:hypothetical protein